MFYNHWDSYPTVLGQSLVDSIPADPEEYQKWLQSQRDFFAKWDSLLQELLIIQPEDMRKLMSGEPHAPAFHAAFDDRLQENAPPYYASGYKDWGIEWTYTIDLDREVFSVDNEAHFRLNCIPTEDKWIKAIFLDDQRRRFLLPQLVPAESVASLCLDPPSFKTSTQYERLRTRLVTPKTLEQLLPSYLTGPRLRWTLFSFIQASKQQDLSTTLLGWQAEDLPFREFAFFILCLAAGGEYLALIDQSRVKEPYVKEPYHSGLFLGLTTNNDVNGDIELATSLGVGHHMDGLPMGSAPTETKYWFEGALICLTPRLDHPGILEKAIADAVQHGRANCTGNSFNAVLISIEHVALIKSLPDGSIDHTGILPLIPITTHSSKDARARYGDKTLDAFYDTISIKKNRDVRNNNRIDAGQLSEHSGEFDIKGGHGDDGQTDTKMEEQDHKEEVEEEKSTDDHAEAKLENEEARVHIEEMEEEMSEDEVLLDPATPVKEASVMNSFLALVQFFNATIRETLRPAQPNESRLPEEICEMVLRSVSDTKTYNSCLKVSRRFRLICQQRPLIMDNIVVLEPFTNGLTSTTSKDGHAGPPRSLSSPNLLAMEISSRQQMEVLLRSGNSGHETLGFLVVAGNEWNRKTYVANGIVEFQGLCVTSPGAHNDGKDKSRKTR